MSHTPGPWSRSWVAGAIRHIVRNVDFDAFWSEEDRDADANHPLRNEADYSLIAAAPELLAALEAMVERRRDPHALEAAAGVARMAIAKARLHD